MTSGQDTLINHTTGGLPVNIYFSFVTFVEHQGNPSGSPIVMQPLRVTFLNVNGKIHSAPSDAKQTEP